jgi:hypothetical protein
MPGKARTALAALLFFGSASVVLAETTNRAAYHGAVIRRAVSVTMSNGRNGAVDHAVKPFTAEEKGWFEPREPGLLSACSRHVQMAVDPALAAKCACLQRLLREQLPREGAPPGLRARIEASIGIRRPRVQPSWPALVALIAITATVASGST